MISKASARFSRIAPRKARVIASLVRGRGVAEALHLLKFTQKSAASVVIKLLESALANALQNNADPDSLIISKATVDKAPDKNWRRWRPRAMGRATRVTKGMSHIAIELAQAKS
ncbi:MAG: 50S ribosomal protein L22 [Myxococcales bacterium]|nr:50S ribosomal protein L22 [Myxococcales bacterium]